MARSTLIPGVTAPQITVVERDYNTYQRYGSGALMDRIGNGGRASAGTWGRWRSSATLENGRVREEGATHRT